MRFTGSLRLMFGAVSLIALSLLFLPDNSGRRMIATALAGGLPSAFHPERYKQVAQLTVPCHLTAPSTPSPLTSAMEYQAGESGAQVGVNGATVEMDIYTPRTFPTDKVLLFVRGGGLRALSTAAANQVRGIGYALMGDTSDSVLTVVPHNEVYTDPTWAPGMGSTPPPPTGTPAAYEEALDVGCAIGWIKQYAYLYGGSTTPKITLVGYSSGAGVVASVMLAADQFLPHPQATLADVTGVITMSGKYDYKKAEAAMDEYFVWYYIHGQPTSSPDTSPLDQGSPNPTSTFSVPWIVEYEQCDADDHYAEAERLALALNLGWNGTLPTPPGTYIYENTQNYTYDGSAAPSMTPVAEPDQQAVHGAGQYALALRGTDLYKLMRSMINGTPPTPRATPTWEQIPLSAGTVRGIRDVGAGADGSIWAVTTNSASDGNGYRVAKYSNKGNGQNHCLTELPDPGPSQPGAQRVGVDAYGDPWETGNNYTVRTLPAGLIAAEPTPSFTVDMHNGFVNGGGIGTGSTFAPVPGAEATTISGGGGTLSGQATPAAYLGYARAIGSIWVVTKTASGTSPSDLKLKYYTGSGFADNAGYGRQITVDGDGDAWLVLSDGSIYTTGSYGVCTGFCPVPAPTAGQVGEYIGNAGSGYTWLTTSPGEQLWYIPGIEAWEYICTSSCGQKVSATLEGMPVIMKDDSSLWIYHACTWPDGSPGGGSTLKCGLAGTAGAASRKSSKKPVGMR